MAEATAAQQQNTTIAIGMPITTITPTTITAIIQSARLTLMLPQVPVIHLSSEPQHSFGEQLLSERQDKPTQLDLHTLSSKNYFLSQQ